MATAYLMRQQSKVDLPGDVRPFSWCVGAGATHHLAVSRLLALFLGHGHWREECLNDLSAGPIPTTRSSYELKPF